MSPRGLVLPLVGVAGALVARHWLDVVEVRGRSMSPTLVPGDRLLVVRATPRMGAIVVAPDPREPGRELIKRVAGFRPDGVLLRGDDPAASTDARTFGSVPAATVQWRAALRYWPWARAGRIGGPPPRRRLDRLDEGGEPACAFPEALIAGD